MRWVAGSIACPPPSPASPPGRRPSLAALGPRTTRTRSHRPNRAPPRTTGRPADAAGHRAARHADRHAAHVRHVPHPRHTARRSGPRGSAPWHVLPVPGHPPSPPRHAAEYDAARHAARARHAPPPQQVARGRALPPRRAGWKPAREHPPPPFPPAAEHDAAHHAAHARHAPRPRHAARRSSPHRNAPLHALPPRRAGEHPVLEHTHTRPAAAHDATRRPCAQLSP